MVVVPDDRAAIAAVIQRERPQGALLVLSGGLGPTDDDFTRSAVADAVGVPLERDPAQVAALRARYAALGRGYADVNDRQADRPCGAEWLENPVGTAPGFWFAFPAGGGVLSLPGVPSEFRTLLDLHLEKILTKCGLHAVRIPETTFKIFGIPESEMQARIAVLPHYDRIRMRSLPAFPEIRLKISQRGEDQSGYESALKEIREDLGWRIFSDREDRSHAQEVVELYRQREMKLQVCEELEASGGELAGMLAQAQLQSPGEPVLVRGVVEEQLPAEISTLSPAVQSSGTSTGWVVLTTRKLPLSEEGKPRALVEWRGSRAQAGPGAEGELLRQLPFSGQKEVSFPVFKGARHRALVAHFSLLQLRLLLAEDSP